MDDTHAQPPSESAPPPQALALQAVLEGANVRALHQELTNRLEARVATVVVASDVVQLSTQAVQVLVSACLSFEASLAFEGIGMRFAYRDPSDEFIDVFADLGLYSHLAARIDVPEEG